MKLNSLRIIRIIFAATLLFAFLLLFLDLRNQMPDELNDIILFFQFIPSFLSMLTAASWAAIGFILVIVLTLLFGRVYCSFLCPLGVLQDVISRVANLFKSKKKKKYTFRRSYSILHYSILILIIAAFLAGFIAPLGWFDPYSLFGRFMTHLVRPLIILSNNLLVDVFQLFKIYSFRPFELKAVNWVSVGIAGGLILLVGTLAVFRGREYCNTVCPVGALLRLVSKFSLFQLRLDQNACNSCGLCARSCKAGCINSKTKELDFERCIACYNCVKACQAGGVKYEKVFFSQKQEVYNPERRHFITSATVALIGGSSSLSLLAQDQQRGLSTTRPEEKTYAICPPGAVSIEHFNSRCTACHLCVSACPKQVLQPSLLEYGLKGFLQPRLDFRTSYCNYDCVVCSQVCPTGAIQPLIMDEKHQVQIGKAFFIRQNCIVRTDKTDCGACSEHCPTKAVQMVPWKHGLRIPEVNQDICIGCGACEYACPTSPYKAIYVDGNAIHQKAMLPSFDENPAKKNSPAEDFPF